MSFLEIFNLFETNISFTKQSKTGYRLQFSIVLIVIFIILCFIKILDDLDNNFVTSIVSLNDYVKINNAITLNFKPDIYTKTKDTPNSCIISSHIKLLGKNYGIKDFKKETYSEDNSYIRHYIPFNEFPNSTIFEEGDYFNLETKIYLKCVDNNNIHLEKTSYDTFEAPTLFISNNNEYDKVLKLTNDEPLVALKKPLLKINNKSKDDLSDKYQIMINSWQFEYEPVKIYDDKDYFSITRLKNRDLEKDYSKDFTVHSTNTKLTKILVTDTYTENKGVLIGFVSYRLSKTGRLIVRVYPKITESIPIFLLGILSTIYLLKIAFYIYDYNGTHCEYINTFFNLTYDNTKPFEDKGNKSTFVSRKTNITKSSDDNSNDKSMETNTNTQILIEKQHSFNENLLKSQDNNNLSIFQYKSPKQAIKETKIFIGTSFIESNSSIVNNSKEEKEELKLDNKNEAVLNEDTFKQYSFTFMDLLAFYCPLSKNYKLKKNLYMNCKDQLNFYLNPLYYFKLCALNEEKVVDYLAENKVYSACFSYQKGIFDISRNMSVLKKLRKSQEIREEKNTDANKLVLITSFTK